MVKGKRVREKGKVNLSGYFKTLNNGDSVALVIEKSIRHSFKDRLQGKSGKVIDSRGKFKLVKLKDGNKTKTIIVHPVHLRRL